MKKTRLFVFAAMLAAAFVSCQKEENLEPQQQPEAPEVATVPFELSARTENAENPSKLSLGVGFKPAWEEGDQLGVYDGTKIQQFDLTDLEAATFTGDIAEGATQLNAIYPYGAATAFAGGKFTASIPAEQVIEAGDSVATGALLAMAQPVELVGGQVQFAFKNVCGLVQFEISKSGQVKEFIISGNKGEKFAGEGVIGFETRVENEVEKLVPVFTPSENAATVVKVRPAGENATFAKGTYYAAVAPVTFAEGFSVTLLTVNDAATVSKGTDKEMIVPRNSGMGLRDLVSIAEWDWKIYTVEQLLAWNAAPTSTNHRVELMADLDMTGVDWTPKTFQGVFEGNGHKIYNFTMNRNGHCGFVEYLNKDAVIRNLILGSKDGETYDGVSKFTYTPGETAGSWIHVGSVAAKVDGNSLLENVTNFIHLETPDSEGTAKVCMGGITSMGSSKETIRNCVNYGNVTCNASKGAVTGASNHQLGGIISKTDGSTQVIGCKNYGTITAGGAYVDNIGGIIANPNGNSTDKGEDKPLIKDCYNYGNILVTKAVSDAKATPMALGGIVGKLTGATVDNCHNHGNISSVCDVLTAMGGVVGAHTLSFESKIIGCSNGVQANTEKGILTFAPDNPTLQPVIGGVLGHHYWKLTDSDNKALNPAALTVQNCSNYAPIELSCIMMRNVGGVVGAVTNQDLAITSKANVDMTIDQCHNYGAITIGGTGSYKSAERHIGGIVGVLNGSEKGKVNITNCTNNAVISTTATDGGENRMAGIVGYTLNGTISISGCTNKGEIKATGTAKNPRPAGIVSVVGSAISISGCYNKAKISNASTTGTIYAGGIVAYSKGASISDCHNQAPVEVTKCGGTVRMGGVAGHMIESGVLTGSTNSAEVTCAANTTSGECQVGGIIGYSLSSTVKECTNLYTAVVNVGGNSFKPRVGGIIGVAEKVALTGNINEGRVFSSAKDNGSGAGYVGGIAGWSKTLTISACQNKGTVDVTAATVAPVIGGILGMPSDNVIISKCRNASTGKVTCNAFPGTVFAGGILGSGVATTKVQECYNDGEVSMSQKSQHAYVGGIAGRSLGTIEACENTSTGVVMISHTGACVKYAFAGGIAGRPNGNTTIKNSINNGTVKAIVNTTNNFTGAAGIIGYPINVTLVGNVNNGYVYAENKHTTGGKAYAGGIFATDVENANNVGATSVTGNKNYGKVELKSVKSAANGVLTSMPGAAAGGLFGLVGKTVNTAIAADNYNYGEVVATDAGADGPAGALAGASAIGAWSGNVGKNVKVNGVLWNTWTNEAAWLCPNAANALTANYVEAPAAN